jgi:protein involved in polysaccharide export with SLBB domain
MRSVGVRLRLLLLVALAAAGCSSLFTGSSSRTNRLTDQAREIRESTPDPPGLPRELDKRTTMPYVVEPGDVLLVQPVSLDSPLRLPGDQPVLPDGTIKLGSYGELQVAGKTVLQIEAEAQRQVRAQVSDASAITVRLVARQTKYYYVLGEVNSPGAFTYNGYETVLNGILAAGGLNDRASRRNIILARPTRPDSCRKVLAVCYEDIVQLGDTATNYQLAPGDRIYVPSRGTCREQKRERKNCDVCDRPQSGCPVYPDKPVSPPSHGWHSVPEPQMPLTPLGPLAPVPGTSQPGGSVLPMPTPESARPETAPPARRLDSE